MQAQDGLVRFVEGLLLHKGFPRFFADHYQWVLQLLEIGDCWNQLNLIKRVAQQILSIADNFGQFKQDYFQDLKYESVPVEVKMYLSNIIREILAFRFNFMRIRLQDRTFRTIYEPFPFVHYPMFPQAHLLSQINRNTIAQQQVTRSIDSSHFEQAQKGMKQLKLQRFQPLHQHSPDFNFQALRQQKHEVLGDKKVEGCKLLSQESRKNAKIAGTRPILAIDTNQKSNVMIKIGKDERKQQKDSNTEKEMSEKQDGLDKIAPKIKIIHKGRKVKNLRSSEAKSNDVNPSPPLSTVKNKQQEEKSNEHYSQLNADSIHRESFCFQMNDVQQRAEKRNIQVPIEMVDQASAIALHAGVGQNNFKASVMEVESKKEEADDPFQHFDKVSDSAVVIDHISAIAQKNVDEVKAQPLQVTFTKCLCKGNAQGAVIFKCSSCSESFHYDCLGASQSQEVECPFCTLRKIDLFSSVKEVIKECYFTDIDQKKFEIAVNLDDYQYLNVPEGKNRGTKDIEIRCLKVEPNYEFREVAWPDEVIIKVGRVKITETYGLHIHSAMTKRRDTPYSIVQAAFKIEIEEEIEDYSSIKISIESKQLSEQQKSRKKINNDSTYLFGVYLIERNSNQDVYRHLLETQTSFASADYINQLFDIGIPEEQLQISMMVCRLQDPYTSQLMNLPARGSNCLHAQCFDFKSYVGLVSHSRNRIWKCPVCSLEAKKFRIDKQQQQMIEAVKLQNISPEEIIFLRQGHILMKVRKEVQQTNKRSQQEGYQIKMEEDRQGSSEQETKEIEYMYLAYDLLLDFRQVQFTSQLCYNKPKRPQKVKPKPGPKYKAHPKNVVCTRSQVNK